MRQYITAKLRHIYTQPMIVVYLDVSTEEAMRRIGRRNRQAESPITLQYLERLKECHDAAYDANYYPMPVSHTKKIDTTSLSVEEVYEQFMKFIDGVKN